MDNTSKNCLSYYLRQYFLVIAVLMLSFNYASASMITYGFDKLTNNNVENLSGQLSITLWDAAMANTEYSTTLASSEVLFTVQNNVGIASNIAEVYFDDGFFGSSTVINSLGGSTAFTGGGANPGNLSGGNDASPPFVATQAFSADILNSGNGVNHADDILGIVLALGSFADFDAVADAVASGDLRFGLHVRSIGTLGGSDGYINTPNAVPVPAAVWLFGTALLGFIGLSRRTKV